MKKFLGMVCLSSAVACASTNGNAVLDWNQVALDAIRTTGMAPPMASRALAIMHTAMYDAWAAYDDTAAPVFSNDAGRAARQGDVYAKETKAIAYAAFRTLLDLFPSQTAALKQAMAVQGYPPADMSRGFGSPAGVGNRAAEAVLEFRHHDGSNQLGDLHPGAYSDYTGYKPVNTVDDLVDPNRWQPLRQPDGTPQVFLVPQWRVVKPFAMTSGSEFRPPAPPPFGSALNRERNAQLVQYSANLTDKDKMIIEFWADGAQTYTPPGHWNAIAEEVAKNRDLSLDDCVKLFFALDNAEMDAGIAGWDAKVAYDTSRPITQIRLLYADETIRGWGGPGLGTVSMPGTQWQPFLPTPPFAEYVSGHSTFSAAAAEILRLFLGDDRFGEEITFQAGSSYVEPGVSPAEAVTLSWPTFTAAADEAGLSRRLGGIHFQDADLNGRTLGRAVARKTWEKAQRFFSGD